MAKKTEQDDKPIKTIGLFDLINDISFDKKGLFHESDEAEKAYSKYMVELMLSQHADCILHINELNRRQFMPKKWHHDYLFHTLGKRKRFGGKLAKPTTSEDVEVIQEVFGYSKEKAEKVLHFFTSEEMVEMKASRFTGGLTKKKNTK